MQLKLCDINFNSFRNKKFNKLKKKGFDSFTFIKKEKYINKRDLKKINSYLGLSLEKKNFFLDFKYNRVILFSELIKKGKKFFIPFYFYKNYNGLIPYIFIKNINLNKFLYPDSYSFYKTYNFIYNLFDYLPFFNKIEKKEKDEFFPFFSFKSFYNYKSVELESFYTHFL
jgi:hypothetical protein